MICGIDPGLSGGIAFLNNNSLEVLPMPISTLVIANKKTRYINILNLCNIFIARNTLNSCIIEKQQSMPNQGLSSTFKNGLGYGILLMLLLENGKNILVYLLIKKKLEH